VLSGQVRKKSPFRVFKYPALGKGKIQTAVFADLASSHGKRPPLGQLSDAPALRYSGFTGLFVHSPARAWRLLGALCLGSFLAAWTPTGTIGRGSAFGRLRVVRSRL